MACSSQIEDRTMFLGFNVGARQEHHVARSYPHPFSQSRRSSVTQKTRGLMAESVCGGDIQSISTGQSAPKSRARFGGGGGQEYKAGGDGGVQFLYLEQ